MKIKNHNRKTQSDDLKKVFLDREYLWKYKIGCALIALGVVLIVSGVLILDTNKAGQYLVWAGLFLCSAGVKIILSANQSNRNKKFKWNPFS